MKTNSKIMLKKKKYISANIGLIRKIRKMTQLELAEKLSMSQEHLSRVETGVMATSMTTLYRIAKVLQVDISVFFKPLISLEKVNKEFISPLDVVIPDNVDDDNY